MQNAISHQPKTLPTFFLTEMWERYGFYVVQTLLAIYLALHFQWSDKRVYALIGSFTALTYLSPFVGGLIADKLIGQKASILLGAIILLISYVALSLSEQIPSLITALASIAVGTGLLKPNIASLLGNQYADDCRFREIGFTIFYLGITTGIILGTTLPGILNQYFGWRIAFLSAAIGLVFSIITFALGIIKHQITDYASTRPKRSSNYIISLVMILLLGFLNQKIMLQPALADFVFPIITACSLAYIFYSIFTEDKHQAKRTLMILVLCFISVMFWSFYFQMFMSLTLFIIRVVQNHWLGITLTPPYYVAIQSLGMIIIGYFLSKKPQTFHLTVEQRTKQILNKFVSALGLMFLNYLLIVLICYLTPAQQKISPLLIIPGYLIISKAELLLSPIGTSAMTILACRKKVSTMMGIFFVSLGLGGFFSGKLACLTAITEKNLGIALLKQQYTVGFLKLSLILLIAFILSLILKACSRKILHDSEEKI